MKPLKSEDLVVFVHGTFANIEKGWASIQDEFHGKLNKAFYRKTGRLFNFTSFEWSGLNSQFERQHAATNLAESMKLMHVDFKRIHLIGHSHGGSVIQFALQKNLAFVSNDWKSKVASLTTIGTPFYRYKGSLKYSDFDIVMASMPGAVLVTIGFGVILNAFSIESKLLVALLYILIYTNLYAYLDGRSIQYRLNKANQNLSKKWFGIYSRNDEAIAGLRSSLNFQIKNDKKKLPVFSSQADLIPYLRKVLSVILFNSAIRNMYAKIISSKIRKFSLGLDRKFYAVNEVSFKPMDNLHIHEMPKSIDDEIYKEVIEDNISKIDQLRKLLNVKKDNLFDIVMNLEDKNKPLLIHSQYFKNEGVIFAIAEHMTKRIDQHKKKNKYR